MPKPQVCPECHAPVDINPQTDMPLWDDCGECGSLLLHARPIPEPSREINLAPARGCLFGLLIGATMWALLYVAYKLL